MGMATETPSSKLDRGPALSPEVEDHVVVGSEKILDSPHVSEGPGRIANAPIPSIFRDDRGEIHRLRCGGGNRINLLYSKSGSMRSGYLHPHAMSRFIVSGQVEVWSLEQAGTDKRVLGAQELFEIPAYVPHILHFLEDSVVVEWWGTDDDSMPEAKTVTSASVKFQCFYYHPYRRIVNIQNSLVFREGEATGQLQRLVPQDADTLSLSALSPTQLGIKQALWGVGGILVGIAIGAVLGGGNSGDQTITARRR